MFHLRDFFHVQAVEPLIHKLLSSPPGVILVSGLDARPKTLFSNDYFDDFIPSGRSTFFRIMIDELLALFPRARLAVLTENQDSLRLSREYSRRVEWWLVNDPEQGQQKITAALRRKPSALVVSELQNSYLTGLFTAVQQGVKVLTQIDSIFTGLELLHQLKCLGASQADLDQVTWLVSIIRIPTLCSECKQSAEPDLGKLESLKRLLPELDVIPTTAFYQPAGCPGCHSTGYAGDAAVYDIYQNPRSTQGAPEHLSFEYYAYHLALRGLLTIDDILFLRQNHLHRAFNRLVASEKALLQLSQALDSRLLQIEAGQRVLKQRTDALIALQTISQALISSTRLDDLSARVCRMAHDLCGADKAILYLPQNNDQVEILAVLGWDGDYQGHLIAASEFPELRTYRQPTPYNNLPPGIPQAKRGPSAQRAGMLVPLLAENLPVGMLLVHTARKPLFTPGEIAILQTLANQAAIAIQRAGLVEQLSQKVADLETAQVGLAQKERLEEEMKLARQVQQHVLPRAFPSLPGVHFAALNEPARQVGGDFYDVFTLDDEHVGFAIGDVCGKGMPAALYMSLTRSLLRAEARRQVHPSKVLRTVNRLLLEQSEPGFFITVFYGILDVNLSQVTYARAGHDRPLLLRGGGILELGGKGVALGVMEDHDFYLTEEALALAPGDRLALFSDGLTDIFPPDSTPFDLSGLKALMLTHSALSPEEYCQKIFIELQKIQGAAEQNDDMTLVVMDWLGK